VDELVADRSEDGEEDGGHRDGHGGHARSSLPVQGAGQRQEDRDDVQRADDHEQRDQ